MYTGLYEANNNTNNDDDDDDDDNTNNKNNEKGETLELVWQVVTSLIKWMDKNCKKTVLQLPDCLNNSNNNNNIFC